MNRLNLISLVAATVVSVSTFAQAGDKTPTGMPWFFQAMPDAVQQCA